MKSLHENPVPSPVRALLAGMLAVLLTACSVGPDYRAPRTDLAAPAWHDLTVAREPDAQSSPVATDTDPDPRWWTRFGDPTLDMLIERARAGNIDLQQAVLRIAEARAQLQAALAQGLPNLRANASYMREQLGIKGLLESNGVYDQVDRLAAPDSPINAVSPGTGPVIRDRALGALGGLTSPVNLWQAGFDASWELDLFGRVRRSVESAHAVVAAARESRNDALLSLEAEVAQTYIQLRGAQAARAIAAQLIDDAHTSVALLHSQAAVGLASALDLEQGEAQARQLEAQLPPLDAQIAQAANGLALLVGEQPGALDAWVLAPHDVPPVPPRVPVGLPSTLARRRPDIREAEAQLHAATANVGVAVAQFYPDITLTGQIGTRATNASDLARWSHLFYSFGPSISLPIFSGGALRANLALADARQAQAALAYRRAVLVALRDVDNALAVYRTDLTHRDALAQSVAAQQRAYALARNRYESGMASYAVVLDTERQLDQARQQYVQATTQLSTDLVALYKALGGGWENADGA